MRPIRLSFLFAAFVGAVALPATNGAWAQQKYSISGPPPSETHFVHDLTFDVGDVPGQVHRMHVHAARSQYLQGGLAFGGVTVKECVQNVFGDYVDQNGPFQGYGVYSLEDGNKVFTRVVGATQADGTGGMTFIFTESFSGGTGKFKGMRGLLRGSGALSPGAGMKVVWNGEYWIEE